MYELGFVTPSKRNRISMVPHVTGQVMVGSDYPLTQRHLPDERNHPFHLHKNPNNARMNIRARILITLQFHFKDTSTTDEVRIFQVLINIQRCASTMLNQLMKIMNSKNTKTAATSK